MRTLSFAALVLGATTASADTLDFEDLACTGTGNLVISDVTGDPQLYTSGDYVLTEPAPGNGFYRFCDGSPSFSGSTGMFSNSAGGGIRLERADGAPFSMDAIGIAELADPIPVTVSFTGTTASGSSVTTSFTTDGVYPAPETYTFPAGWDNVVAVEWTQDPNFHQFDDIVVNRTGGPSLRFTGSCPGMITIDITGLTPGSSFAAVRSGSLGTSSIPGGGCAGTNLGLASPRLVGIFPSGSGSRAFMPSIGPGSCGDFVRVVDLDTCTTTNVEQF